MRDEALVNGSAFGVGFVVGEWVCTKGERGRRHQAVDEGGFLG
jgi:hypothetical protein